MNLNIYENAIGEYLDSLKDTLNDLQSNAGLTEEYALELLQKNETRIRKLLETNEPYARLDLDLEHLEYKDRNKYSLTDIAKKKDSTNPSYIIQAWLRDVKTLELLCLWEKEHNPDFNLDEAVKLIAKTKEASFTLTAKIWIANTNAKGLISKQGKGGGTFASHEIAIDFITWLFPQKRYELTKMITNRILQMKEVRE